jgi:hypothetical protein
METTDKLMVDYGKIEDLFSELEEIKFELDGIVFAAKSMQRTLSLASQELQRMLSDEDGDGLDDELEEDVPVPE